MIRPILRHGADVLHRPALPVEAVTADIQQLIDDMVQTMYAAPGVGLAATQVGVPLRVFVADVTVGRDSAGAPRLREPDVRRARRHAARRRRVPERPRLQRHGGPAQSASSSAGWTATGVPHTVEGTGLLARCFQHEMDHLDGRLFVDHLRGLQKDLIVRKIKKLARAGKW